MRRVFEACVSPKLFDVIKEQTTTPSQEVLLEPVIHRLVHETVFEIEGWKRIPAVRRIFNKHDLKVSVFYLDRY